MGVNYEVRLLIFIDSATASLHRRHIIVAKIPPWKGWIRDSFNQAHCFDLLFKYDLHNGFHHSFGVDRSLPVVIPVISVLLVYTLLACFLSLKSLLKRNIPFCLQALWICHSNLTLTCVQKAAPEQGAQGLGMIGELHLMLLLMGLQISLGLTVGDIVIQRKMVIWMADLVQAQTAVARQHDCPLLHLHLVDTRCSVEWR